jgi:alpha-ketoglutarate-dependent taurine dioxygenase
MATRTIPTLELDPLTARVGVEVRGVDLSAPIAPDVVAALRDALLRWFVVAIPGQHLDADALVEFARAFGEVTPAWPVMRGETGASSEVALFDSTTGGTKQSTGQWHADITYVEEPPAISFLQAVEVPPAGGDTLFASAEVAYETLSAPLQQLCDGLGAVHDSRGWGPQLVDYLAATGEGWWNGERVTHLDPVVHPVVRVHPETGRKSLYVEPAATTRVEGLAPHESSDLLALLQAHITRPEHVVRYRWDEGTVVIWDQRNTWHRAVDDYGDARRVVQRVSVQGDRPTGPAGSAGSASA